MALSRDIYIIDIIDVAIRGLATRVLRREHALSLFGRPGSREWRLPISP